MKKVLAGIAVLAVAAVAQAELLATWEFDTANASTLKAETGAVNAGQVTFGELSRVNGLQTATTKTFANFSANTWTASKTGDEAFDNGKAGLGFTIDVASGYEIADSYIVSAAANAGNSGPSQLQWSLNGSDVGAAWTLATSAAAEKSTADSKFTVSAGNNTMLLYASSTAGAKSGTALGSTGRADFNTKITFDGTIQAASSPSEVPEPATMSLLGLGALAIALRRKLRK